MNDWIYWLIGLMIISTLLKVMAPKIKGWVGETAVASILASLPKEEYKVLNNVMLQTNHGTTQIDHVVISIYGIFVIETKNYKGLITGGENSEKWTKNMYGKKYPFRNPLKQNYGHVKALEELLELPESKFVPIIVFSVNATLKVKTDKLVVYTVKLKRAIQSFTEKLFEKSELDGIVEQITSSNIDSKETRKEHVTNIHNNIAADKQSIKQGLCPRCGGALVQRKGKYGTFLGCSNYPKCRYIAK
ncbi:MAG TPA: NERD nuclease [Lachnospiraceae bacterium]|nr:NERD nuclease [Lachnospiraceae bacterium]